MADLLAKLYAEPPKLPVLLGSFILILIIGFFDLLTGFEFTLAIFYLLPVWLSAWFLGFWPGASISVLCGIAWLITDMVSGHDYLHPLLPYWNMLVRLLFFLITAYLLSEIKDRERRRRTIERVYFHDILNMMTAIRGFAEFLRHSDPGDKREIFDAIYNASDQVIDEIEMQRTLSAAEHGELEVDINPVSARTLLERGLEWYRHHDAGRERALVLDPQSEDAVLESDPALLNRILGNMIKNALEASDPGETITAGCRTAGERIEFWVHNSTVIPKDVQSRIFQADFSTKGKGRGLGTYSMKLLTGRLGGEVSFITSENEGTTFLARYPLRRSRS